LAQEGGPSEITGTPFYSSLLRSAPILIFSQFPSPEFKEVSANGNWFPNYSPFFSWLPCGCVVLPVTTLRKLHFSSEVTNSTLPMKPPLDLFFFSCTHKPAGTFSFRAPISLALRAVLSKRFPLAEHLSVL